MNIMLLGAGGLIGNALANQILDAGHTLLAVSRSGQLPRRLLPFSVQGDRASPDKISGFVDTYAPDVLIDLVGYTETESAELLKAIDGRLGRYVLLSSADVYRNYGLLNRMEAGAPDQGILTEASPLREAFYPYRTDTMRRADDPLKWMDAYDKILVEAAVRTLKMDWTICRLPMVYGAGDPQMRFAWATSPVTANMEEVTLPQAWLDWTTTYGFVENVAAGVLAAALHPSGANQVFNITDAPARSHRSWFEDIAQVAGWRGDLLVSDDPDHPIAQATAQLDLSVPLRLSGALLEDLTGFVPPVSQDEAIRQILSSG